MTRPIPTIKGLVEGFGKHIKQLKAPEYKESQVRQNYIDPFWNLLGWDVANDDQLAPQDVDVLIEPSMDSAEDDGLRSRAPDYLFRILGFPRFVVEAKKPAVEVDTDTKSIYQAKRYSWSARIPFAILTNFEQLRLYDTTLEPILNEPNRGLIKDFAFSFENYPAKWDEIVATFGRDAVASGSLEHLRARIRKVPSGRRLTSVDRMLFELRGDEPIDRIFLNYLERFRQRFADAIFHDNKPEFPNADTHHGAARLTEAVQRLIDRLVFIRVCEDRGIAAWGGLRDTLTRISAEGGELYPSLCNRFRFLDHEYNGYLFKPHFSETLAVSDEILASFIRKLYPPDGAWNFAAIGDDIFGIIYERFLGNVVTVKHGHVSVDEKPEVRHANGVHYTPRFIIDTIIRRVIGPKIAGKSPTELLAIKILDPACGSGSFLVAAFQYLIDHCLSAIAANPALASVPASPKARKKRKEIAFKDKSGMWHLAPDFKAALLTNCMHGVDIDQQAVEVTVMSLYLKMLEGKLPNNWQKEWLENQLLPPLDNNILCGNALIDSSNFNKYSRHLHGGLFPDEDEDLLFRMNRFDWDSRTCGFGRLQGFDCIIGNPPYIRVQELNKWAPEECQFYKWRYESAKKGNYDIYVAFVERCLELLGTDGLLGFIMPHKFWQAQYGVGLRKLLTGGAHLQSVVDFGDQQVFRTATTYTAVHVLGKACSELPIAYAKVFDLFDGDAQCRAIDAPRPVDGVLSFLAPRKMPASGWAFVESATSSIMEWLSAQGQSLGEYAAKIFVGIQTSADKVFILERRDERYFSQELQSEVDLESTLCHRMLKGSVHMKRWVPAASEKVVIFPYHLTGGSFRLIPERQMREDTPKTWAYLDRCRPSLGERERGTHEGSNWYGYVYPKNLSSMSLPKILTPSLARWGEFCLDRTGDEFFVGSGGGGGGGYGVLLHDPSQYEYILGLLNSTLLNWFVQQITTPFHSGWFAYNKQFIEKIPIKLPTTPDDRVKAGQIAESVREIINATVRLKAITLSDRERKTLEGRIELHEKRINEDVFALYRVSGLPNG